MICSWHKLLFCFDVGHPQIEAVFVAVLNVIDNTGIQLLKLPCGGSQQWQPNDKMKAHMVLHQYVNGTKFRDYFAYDDDDLL
jgi:hypothetical protein